MIKSFVQSVVQKGKDIIIPIDIGKTVQFGNDCFVKVDHIEQGRWFHKIYIRVIDGKVHSNKIIKVLNERVFELGGTLYLKGESIEKVLVNGNEII